MVLDHTNDFIKLRGISVKFAWFQHSPPPPDFRGDLEHIEYWILAGGGLQFNESSSIYLIIACNIDFFMGINFC